MRVKRKQGREVVQQTGQEYQADLWHHAEYGTLGDPLFDSVLRLPDWPAVVELQQQVPGEDYTDQPEQLRGDVLAPGGCEVCGQPCDLLRCDDCLDRGAVLHE